MQAQVVKGVRWNHPGIFPNFATGTQVEITGPEDDEFLGWLPVTIEKWETFVPESYLKGERLNRSYNPTELEVQIGEILEILEIANAWLLAKTEYGKIGWIPAERVVSI